MKVLNIKIILKLFDITYIYIEIISYVSMLLFIISPQSRSHLFDYSKIFRRTEHKVQKLIFLCGTQSFSFDKIKFLLYNSALDQNYIVENFSEPFSH